MTRLNDGSFLPPWKPCSRLEVDVFGISQAYVQGGRLLIEFEFARYSYLDKDFPPLPQIRYVPKSLAEVVRLISERGVFLTSQGFQKLSGLGIPYLSSKQQVMLLIS